MQGWLGNGRLPDFGIHWCFLHVNPGGDARLYSSMFREWRAAQEMPKTYPTPKYAQFMRIESGVEKIRQARSVVSHGYNGQIETRAVGAISKRTSIERGPSAANSVFVNTTLASSALVNRPRRRSLDDLLENESN